MIIVSFLTAAEMTMAVLRAVILLFAARSSICFQCQPSVNARAFSTALWETSFSQSADLKAIDQELKNLITSVDLGNMKNSINKISSLFEMPDLNVLTSAKPLELPAVEVPGLDLTIPSVSVPAETAAVAVAAVLVALATGGAATMSTTAAKSNAEKGRGVDLSIPYDAAARLAYFKWLTENDQKFNPDGFLEFKKMYESEAIADATKKKLARDRMTFANKAPDPVPERKITPKPVVQETEAPPSPSPFFFADTD